jgi:hypothetical protein
MAKIRRLIVVTSCFVGARKVVLLSKSHCRLLCGRRDSNQLIKSRLAPRFSWNRAQGSAKCLSAWGPSRALLLPLPPLPVNLYFLFPTRSFFDLSNIFFFPISLSASYIILLSGNRLQHLFGYFAGGKKKKK